jgi:hypothetical protein
MLILVLLETYKKQKLLVNYYFGKFHENGSSLYIYMYYCFCHTQRIHLFITISENGLGLLLLSQWGETMSLWNWVNMEHQWNDSDWGKLKDLEKNKLCFGTALWTWSWLLLWYTFTYDNSLKVLVKSKKVCNGTPWMFTETLIVLGEFILKMSCLLIYLKYACFVIYMQCWMSVNEKGHERTDSHILHRIIKAYTRKDQQMMKVLSEHCWFEVVIIQY